MSDTTTHLLLPYILAAQAQKHVTHNEALRILDGLVQLSVLDRDLTAPPGSPGDGDRYIVASGATGDWAGWDLNVALWTDGAWLRLPPRPGWRAWVEDEGLLLVYDGAGWDGTTPATLQNMALLGVNTTADAVNRFATAAPATLFTHEGAGHQIKINKSGATDTASLLYQTGFSGRAEMGLAGNDDFAVKVSADGSNWNTALTADAGTGAVTLGTPLGLASGGTGGTTVVAARANLGLGTAATQDVTNSPDARVAGRVLKVGDSARLLKWTPNVVLRNHVAEAAWLSSISAADLVWWSVCWSPELGLFCAVANNGTGNRVMTSPDGINWTARTSAVDNIWYSVCWSPELGLFCAVAISGTGDRVMTSPDGVNWTARASAADNQWTSLCWSPELGLFCAVANSGLNRVMTSPDGITWTSISSPIKDWFSVCWSPELGLFCAVAKSGTGDKVMTSPDGINWAAQTSASDNGWISVCWSPELGLFCAVAISGTGDRVMTSPDGVNWTAQTTPADNEWLSVCWAPELGLFCAVSRTGSGDRVMTSPDGITWTARASAADNQWTSVCWSPELGLFCAVARSGTGNRVMTSVSAYSYTYRS